MVIHVIFQVQLIGEKVLDPAIHCCEKCNMPILIYGRMVRLNDLFFICCILISHYITTCCLLAVSGCQSCLFLTSDTLQTRILFWLCKEDREELPQVRITNIHDFLLGSGLYMGKWVHCLYLGGKHWSLVIKTQSSITQGKMGKFWDNSWDRIYTIYLSSV